MSDSDQIDLRRARGEYASSASGHPTCYAPPSHPLPGPAAEPLFSCDRVELRTIFDLYGRKVAEGEWRDYAIDFHRDRAVFSIFRRTSENPLYRIEKDPNRSRRQGAYAIVSSAGFVMKRGHDLAKVIAVSDKRLKLVT